MENDNLPETKEKNISVSFFKKILPAINFHAYIIDHVWIV